MFSASVWLSMIRPEPEWGPYLAEHRRLDKYLDEYDPMAGDTDKGKDNPAMDLADTKSNTHM